MTSPTKTGQGVVDCPHCNGTGKQPLPDPYAWYGGQVDVEVVRRIVELKKRTNSTRVYP